jgi:hypothetical protein
MVIPDMLRHPAVQRWLGGIFPAWTLLDPKSFEALYLQSQPDDGPLRLGNDVSPEVSPIVRNALLLLHKASSGPGLKLTETGNLARRVVAEMIDLLPWPGFDKEMQFSVCKVINETDYLPLLFLHELLRTAKLARRHRGFLKPSRLARSVIDEPASRGLQGYLFDVAFWQLDLMTPGGNLRLGWPQDHIGIVLWSLSVAANDWQPAKRLARLCTLPDDGVVESPLDRGSAVFEYDILRPLIWFGLIEDDRQISGQTGIFHKHRYRKTALFDQFLLFDIKLERSPEQRH